MLSTAIPILIAAIVIVIISNGIFNIPINPRTEPIDNIFGTRAIKEIFNDLNNIKNKNLIKIGQTILLNKSQDVYFIGDDNFIAITKYNRSHFYAKAVYDLSLEFK